MLYNKPLDNKLLASELSFYKLGFTKQQIHGLSLYLNLLVTWNKKINLTGAKKWEEILHELIVDSFYLGEFLKKIPLAKKNLTLDIGAGAGIPGIPLRLIWAKGKYILIEPKQKKCAFLQFALSKLTLPDTFVCQSRLENLPKNLLSPDLILSRALKSFEDFIQLLEKSSCNPKLLLLFSNQPLEGRTVSFSGYSLEKVYPYVLKNEKKRYLLLFSSKSSLS